MGSWIESYKRMQWRAREGDVKSVALQLNLGVEDFKPKHMGIRPASLKDIESLLSVGYVKKRKNPFNSKQTYSFAGGGLVDGYPSQNGVIGYITPQDSSEPYRIVVYTTFPGLGKWDTFQLVEKTTK
jgi:hypothetical protein